MHLPRGRISLLRLCLAVLLPFILLFFNANKKKIKIAFNYKFKLFIVLFLFI